MTSRTTLSLNKETIRVLSTAMIVGGAQTNTDGPSVNTCPTTFGDPTPKESPPEPGQPRPPEPEEQ